MNSILEREIVKEIKTWICEECDRSFKAKRSLSYHCFTKHGLDITKRKNSQIMKKCMVTETEKVKTGWTANMTSLRERMNGDGRDVTLDEVVALVTLSEMDRPASLQPQQQEMKVEAEVKSSSPPIGRDRSLSITALKDTLKARFDNKTAANNNNKNNNNNNNTNNNNINNNNNAAGNHDNNNNDLDLSYDLHRGEATDINNNTASTCTPDQNLQTTSVEPTRRSRRLASRGDRKSFASVVNGNRDTPTAAAVNRAEGYDSDEELEEEAEDEEKKNNAAIAVSSSDDNEPLVRVEARKSMKLADKPEIRTITHGLPATAISVTSLNSMPTLTQPPLPSLANLLNDPATHASGGTLDPMFLTTKTTTIATRLDGVYVYDKKQGNPELKISLYKCELCSQFFPFWPLLKEHLGVTHFNEEPHTNILNCMPSTKSETSFTPPQDQDHMYTCPECQKSFVGGSSFARHLLTHKVDGEDAEDGADTSDSKSKMIQDLIDKMSSTSGEHMDTAHTDITMAAAALIEFGPKTTGIRASPGSGSQIYRCRYCNKSFVGYFRWQRHERVHTGFKPCSCVHCGKRFSEQRNLRHHMLRFHGGDGVDDEDTPRLLLQMHRRRERNKRNVSPNNAAKRRTGVGGGGTSTSSQRLSFVSPEMIQNTIGQTDCQDELLSSNDVNHDSMSVFPGQPLGVDDDCLEATPLIHAPAVTAAEVVSGVMDTALVSDDEAESIAMAINLVSQIRAENSLPDDITVVIPADVTPPPASTPPSPRTPPSSTPPPPSVGQLVSELALDTVTAASSSILADDKPWSVTNVGAMLDSPVSIRTLSDILAAPTKSSLEVDNIIKKTLPTQFQNNSCYMLMESGMDRRSVNCKRRRVNKEYDDDSDTDTNTDTASNASLSNKSTLSKTNTRLNIVNTQLKRSEAVTMFRNDDGHIVYRCHYCNKKFQTHSDLNRHMDFHEDIRPYKCNFCDYYARTNSQLKVHMMRHQGIRDFHCKLCCYKGVTQSDLNRHTKSQVHLLKQLNVCSVCGEGFVTSNHMLRHRCNGIRLAGK